MRHHHHHHPHPRVRRGRPQLAAHTHHDAHAAGRVGHALAAAPHHAAVWRLARAGPSFPDPASGRGPQPCAHTHAAAAPRRLAPRARLGVRFGLGARRVWPSTCNMCSCTPACCARACCPCTPEPIQAAALSAASLAVAVAVAVAVAAAALAPTSAPTAHLQTGRPFQPLCALSPRRAQLRPRSTRRLCAQLPALCCFYAPA